MRGQTSLEYLLITSGVLVIALVAGYYLVSSAASAVPAPPPRPSLALIVDPASPSVGALVTITCSADDAQAIRIYLDANLVQTCSASPCTYTTTFPSPGTHNTACEGIFQDGSRWTASYFDVAGSAPPPQAPPPPADAPPTVTITSPPNGSTYTAPASVDVSFTASDDVALSSVSIDCGNGETNTWTSPSNPFSTTYTCDYSSPGTYTITVTATDSAGNAEQNAVFVSILSSNPSPSPVPPPSPPGGGGALPVPGTPSIP